jgi:hypothetical protein
LLEQKRKSTRPRGRMDVDVLLAGGTLLVRETRHLVDA